MSYTSVAIANCLYKGEITIYTHSFGKLCTIHILSTIIISMSFPPPYLNIPTVILSYPSLLLFCIFFQICSNSLMIAGPLMSPCWQTSSFSSHKNSVILHYKFIKILFISCNNIVIKVINCPYLLLQLLVLSLIGTFVFNFSLLYRYF